jgi:hypothetical protein
MKKFKTNYRLWGIISIILFLIPWFIPMTGKRENMPLVYQLLGLFSAEHFLTTLKNAVQLSLFLSIPAIAIGWVLHSVILIIKQSTEQKNSGDGVPPPQI